MYILYSFNLIWLNLFLFFKNIGGRESESVRERYVSLYVVKENEICYYLMLFLKFIGRVKLMNFDDINLLVVDYFINIYLYYIIIWELVNKIVF